MAAASVMKLPSSNSSCQIFRITHHELKASKAVVAPPSLSIFARALDHTAVHVVVNLTIFVNAIQMGVAVDVKGGDWDALWDGFEKYFTAFFALEMLLKIAALRLRYFREPWNLFDFFIVCISLVDTMVSSFSQKSSFVSIIGILRLLRLLRMLKLLRVVPQFRILFDGILAALQSMFWVGALCGLLLYMVAVASVRLLGGDDAGFGMVADDEASLMAEAASFNNYQYFGTVSRSLLSLFNLVVMAELDAIVRPIWEIQPFVTIGLVLLSFIMMFGVLNILVGMIMDNVMRTVKQMDQETGKHERLRRAALTKEISDILFQVDTNGDGSITSDEFFDKSNNERLQELLIELQLPHGFTERDLFKFLDRQGQRCVTYDQFSDGIVGIVMNSEVQRDVVMQARISDVRDEIIDLRESLSSQISTLSERLAVELKRLTTHATLRSSDGSSTFGSGPQGEVEQKLQETIKVHAKESQTEGRAVESQKLLELETPSISFVPHATQRRGAADARMQDRNSADLKRPDNELSTFDADGLLQCKFDSGATPDLEERISTLEGRHAARVSASEAALEDLLAVRAALDSCVDELRSSLGGAMRPTTTSTLGPHHIRHHESSTLIPYHGEKVAGPDAWLPSVRPRHDLASRKAEEGTSSQGMYFMTEESSKSRQSALAPSGRGGLLSADLFYV